MKVLYDNFPLRSRVCPAGTVDDEKFHTLKVFERVNGSRMVTAVRAVIADNVLMIAADSDQGPMLIFREKIDSESLVLEKGPQKIARLRTLSGKVVFLEKDANCGCGSRLRGWNPYKTMYASGDPTE